MGKTNLVIIVALCIMMYIVKFAHWPSHWQPASCDCRSLIDRYSPLLALWMLKTPSLGWGPIFSLQGILLTASYLDRSLTAGRLHKGWCRSDGGIIRPVCKPPSTESRNVGSFVQLWRRFENRCYLTITNMYTPYTEFTCFLCYLYYACEEKPSLDKGLFRLN